MWAKARVPEETLLICPRRDKCIRRVNVTFPKIQWYWTSDHTGSTGIEFAVATAFRSILVTLPKNPLPIPTLSSQFQSSDYPMPCRCRQSRSHLSTVVGLPSVS